MTHFNNWNLSSHLAVPELRQVPSSLLAAIDAEQSPCAQTDSTCQALAFAGPDWQGQETSCYAWLGLPAGASETQPAPGIVLVHGGLGTAYADWVRLWTSRGYAAIAIDHGGCVPVLTGRNQYLRLPDGGPENCGGFEHVALPPHDRWNYHAVANVIRSHSLLRSLSQVNADCIAVTGVSWGGYLTCLCAALDTRFVCAAPVYGCGYMMESPQQTPQGRGLSAEQVTEWSQLWDPKHYVTQVTQPMCWVNGTNDEHFTPAMWQASTALPSGEVKRSFQLGLMHNQEVGATPRELLAIVQHYAGPGLGSTMSMSDPVGFSDCHYHHGELRCALGASSSGQVDGSYEPAMIYTTDRGPWPNRTWQQLPASFSPASGLLSVACPSTVTAACGQLTAPDGCRYSSPLWITADDRIGR